MQEKENYQSHRPLLNHAKAVIAENAKRRKLTASGYNVFTVLDRLRDENKGHSAFIANLLDPMGSHSQGNVFLKMFLAELFPEKEFHFESDWYVKTEKYAPTGAEVENSVHEGRIDIWIEGPKETIIIENKIDAGDQDKQLERYIKYAKGLTSNNSIYVIYLTPEGRSPSEYSLGSYYNADLEQEIAAYLEASYEEHIYDWIDKCLKESTSLPVLRETLVQYKKTIRQITGKIEDEELGMSLSNLLEKREDIIAATELGKAAVEKLSELERAFWNKVKQSLLELVASEDAIYITGKIDGRYYRVGFKVAQYEESDLHFHIERDSSSDKIYVGFRQTQKGTNTYHTGSKFSPILKDLIEPITTKWPSNNYWLGWECLEDVASFMPGKSDFVGYLAGSALEASVELICNKVNEIISKLTKCEVPNGVQIISFKKS